MYAVIKTGGKQYRVENDQKLLVERINADEGSKLVQLFKKDDPVIGAAMDVYEVEGDMAELVDTLKRTANIQGQMV